MEQLFIGILNNAITVSILIVAVIIVRALGKKMPKWISCMLWMIVAIKLVVPIQFESVLSLIPSGKPIPANIVMEANPQISSGISSFDKIVNPVIGRNFTPDKAASVNPLQIVIHIAGAVWLAGVIVMLTYAVTTYMLIRKKVSTSVKIDSKVYECDDISDSFILGTISPKVYIPSSLSKGARQYILKHEFAHLSRYDHLWKPLGFLILSVYWFNPLCWIAYVLLCRDIEYACDEKVTENIENGEKAEYCRILLENSMPRKMVAACPLAFGGTDVKNRIKNVVNYKKPAFWITLVSVMACAVVGVCFATSKSTKTATEQQTVKPDKASDDRQIGAEVWYESEVAGDCVILKKTEKKNDDIGLTNIFDSPEAALKVLESDGENWNIVSSGEKYAVLANSICEFNETEDGIEVVDVGSDHQYRIKYEDGYAHFFYE